MRDMITAGAAALGALGILAVPVGAVPVVEQRAADASEEAMAVIGSHDAGRFGSDPMYAAELRAKLEALRPRVRAERVIFALDFVRHSAMLIEGRHEESFQLGAELVREQPAMSFLYPTAIWAAHYAGKGTETIALLEAAVKHVADPEERKMIRDGIDREIVLHLLSRLGEAEDKGAQPRAAEALLALGWPADGRIVDSDGLRTIAMEGRRERGDTAGAQTLASQIGEPRSLLQLLVDKRYDSFFDGGKDRVARLEAAIASYDAHTAKRLQNNPDDLDALLDRAQLLRSLGKEAEALELLLPKTKDMPAVVEAGEKAFWIVNEAAYALNAVGRSGEAVALMEALLKLPLAEHPSLISMAINHGAVLNEAGRHREAAEWEAALESGAKGYANDFGFMWIWAEAACGHLLAKDAAGAAPWMAKLATGSDNNPAAHTRALLCANDLDDAEKLVVARLSGDGREGALLALQDYSLGRVAPGATSVIKDRWDALRTRASVQAAIAKSGRVLRVPLAPIYWGDV